MHRLLLVEDDSSLAMGIEFSFKDEGYEIQTASTIEDGKGLYNEKSFDLILLDVNLPDGSGYDLCKYIRKESDVPIIFLTACDEEVNVVLGLDIGGDDYISKPFRIRELLSRIRALLRRTAKNINTTSELKSGDIVVSISAAKVTKKGQELNLTALEYKLLLYFMKNPLNLLRREEILSVLTEGEEVFFDENTLSVYIKRLREKIEDNTKEPQYIITQRGLGYKWNKKVIEG